MNMKGFLKGPFLLILTLSASCFFYQTARFSLSPFWMLQTIQWTQLGLILILSARRISAPSLGLIVFGYILSRFLLFQAPPLLEDDYYRYLWDGHLVTEGINPYLFPPSDSFWSNISSEWRQHINFPDIRTIYPPLTQIYFSVIYKFSGESIIGLRLGALAFESLLVMLLYKVCQKEKLSLKPLAIFLFFPTLMKENVNSVHFDLLATLFTFVFFLKLKEAGMSAKSVAVTWVSLACAVLTKIFPLLLLPLAFFCSARRFFGLILFFSILFIAYVPFLGAGLNVFGGTNAFAKNWLFFESLPFYFHKIYTYLFTRPFFHQIGLTQLFNADQLTRLTSIFFVVLITGWITLSKKIRLENKFFILFLVLYSLSPVVNTWYWLWVLPFLLLYAPRVSWIFPVFTTLGYSWFEDQELYHRLHLPIYGAFISALIFYVIKTNYDGLPRWRIADFSQIT